MMKAFSALASAALVAAALLAPASLQEKTVLDVVKTDARFSTLAGLIEKVDLTGTLKGAGPFTLFAPTNEAFAKLPKKTLARIEADPGILKKVVAYHVVSGKYMAADLKTTKSTTVEGEDIAIRIPKKAGVGKNGKVRGPRIGNANLVQSDLLASNGVIHAIDRVLLPPSLNLSPKRGGGKKNGGAPATTPPPAGSGAAGPSAGGKTTGGGR